MLWTEICVETMEIEPRMSLLYTHAFLYDSKALGGGEALKTLSREL
jgi:hypothetical protein